MRCERMDRDTVGGSNSADWQGRVRFIRGLLCSYMYLECVEAVDTDTKSGKVEVKRNGDLPCGHVISWVLR